MEGGASSSDFSAHAQLMMGLGVCGYCSVQYTVALEMLRDLDTLNCVYFHSFIEAICDVINCVHLQNVVTRRFFGK